MGQPHMKQALVICFLAFGLVAEVSGILHVKANLNFGIKPNKEKFLRLSKHFPRCCREKLKLLSHSIYGFGTIKFGKPKGHHGGWAAAPNNHLTPGHHSNHPKTGNTPKYNYQSYPKPGPPSYTPKSNSHLSQEPAYHPTQPQSNVPKYPSHAPPSDLHKYPYSTGPIGPPPPPPRPDAVDHHPNLFPPTTDSPRFYLNLISPKPNYEASYPSFSSSNGEFGDKEESPRPTHDPPPHTDFDREPYENFQNSPPTQEEPYENFPSSQVSDGTPYGNFPSSTGPGRENFGGTNEVAEGENNPGDYPVPPGSFFQPHILQATQWMPVKGPKLADVLKARRQSQKDNSISDRSSTVDGEGAKGLKYRVYEWGDDEVVILEGDLDMKPGSVSDSGSVAKAHVYSKKDGKLQRTIELSLVSQNQADNTVTATNTNSIQKSLDNKKS